MRRSTHRPKRTRDAGRAKRRFDNPHKGPRQNESSPRPMSRDDSTDNDEALLIGRNPVREALRASRPIARLWVQDGEVEGSLREIMRLAHEQHIPLSAVPRTRLDMMAGSGGHQGVVAAVSIKPMLELEELEPIIKGATAPPFILLLDGVQDPQNLGAILRVANASGALAVVIPQRGQVGLTATVAKASAGAIEYVPVVRVVNLSQAVEVLKSWGVFIYAADPLADTSYTSVDWRGAVGIVIGGEGNGVRPLVMKRCDGTVSLPMVGSVASLNAATAAAVLSFEVLRQRMAGLSKM